MDLQTVAQEFESYYELKYGRKPRFVRKRQEPDESPVLPRLQPAGSASRQRGRAAQKKSMGASSPVSPASGGDPLGPSDVCVSGKSLKGSVQASNQTEQEEMGPRSHPRVLRPLPPELHQEPELRALASTITRSATLKSHETQLQSPLPYPSSTVDLTTGTSSSVARG